MSYFINYKNGQTTINTYRFPDATVTDIKDILAAVRENRGEVLAASVTIEDLANLPGFQDQQ